MSAVSAAMLKKALPDAEIIVDLMEHTVYAKHEEDVYAIAYAPERGYVASADNLLDYVEQRAETLEEAVALIVSWKQAAAERDSE